MPYLCVCGTTYPVVRQRWVDRDAQPELHAQILIDGPLRGACPTCGESALGRSSWLEVVPSEASATLVLGPHQRAELVDALKAHLDRVSQSDAAMPTWLLQPSWRFEGARAGATNSGALPVSPHSRALAVSLMDELDSGPIQTADADDAGTAESIARSSSAGVPRLVGARRSNSTTASSEDAHVATLVLEGDMPAVHVALKDEVRSQWGRAALRALPIHLRQHGYPLVGVRVVASYLGSNSVVDALVDVADEAANEIFARLSAAFAVRVSMTDADGNTPVSREVSAEDLGRNAALCLESARGVLASEEFPPTAFERAWASLGECSAAERLVPAAHALAPGDFRHLLTPRESMLALDALDAASDKPNLAHLLEVDGLPVGEFEAIRKRVLAAALEHGLCAPRRFWRRVIASGLAQDAGDYARRLATARAVWEQGDDDLDEVAQQRAWEAIRELCIRRDLPFPEELMAALGIEEASRPQRTGTGSKAAAGEIQVNEVEVVERRPPPSASSPPAPSPLPHEEAVPSEDPDAPTPSTGMRVPANEPSTALVHSVEGLGETGEMVGLEAAFEALDTAKGAELLALLPTLKNFGSDAVPSLVARLDSPRREVRQAVLAMLSLTADGASLRPLVTRLYGESSKVWTDVARTLGAFGPRALGPITAYLRDRPPPRPGDEAVLRAARAMAEVAVADEGQGTAQDAVEALADAPQRAVARAASRALATLHDVRDAKAQVFGHAPMPEVTQVRGFSRRIMDALGLAGPLAKPQQQTQIIDLGELMEMQEAADEVTELDPEELESL